jgi:type I protein arginine methyltransferase
VRRPASYNVTSYGDMITDAARMNPYAQALAATVRPGCTVLDIGAGTGIFSLLACKFGAGRVHAVEPADAIGVARAMAAANGVADRITFHHALSSAVELPERADVMVSDLRGVLPLFQHHIPAIVDARSRLLAPDGALIPRRDTLWAALVNDERSYRPYAEPWLTNTFDLDLRAGHALAVNTWRKVNAKAEHLLTPAQHWATLDYATITSPHVTGEVAWTVEREGTAHGLVIWFDTELADGIGSPTPQGGRNSSTARRSSPSRRRSRSRGRHRDRRATREPGRG